MVDKKRISQKKLKAKNLVPQLPKKNTQQKPKEKESTTTKKETTKSSDEVEPYEEDRLG